MFTNIQNTPKSDATTPPDPAQQVRELLLGCHARIRHFMGVAEKLARVEGAPEADIATAAGHVVRYFTVALPLHEADENISLHPRLQAAHAGPRIFTANESMVAEHAKINQTLQQLLPLWQSVQQAPSTLQGVRGDLLRLTEELAQLFEVHLNLEEQILFPAMERLLTPEDLTAMSVEMQERRATK